MRVGSVASQGVSQALRPRGERGVRGVVFPDTEHGVNAKLKEQGLLFPAESEKRGGFMYQLPIDDRPRVLRITNFLSSDNEGST